MGRLRTTDGFWAGASFAFAARALTTVTVEVTGAAFFAAAVFFGAAFFAAAVFFGAAFFLAAAFFGVASLAAASSVAAFFFAGARFFFTGLP